MNENIFNIINNDTLILDYEENINIDNYVTIANDLCDNLIYNQITNKYILDTSLSQLKNLVDTLVYNVNYVFDTSFLTLHAQIENMNEIGRNITEELSILSNLNIENDFIRESSFNLLQTNTTNSLNLLENNLTSSFNSLQLDISNLSNYVENLIDTSINELKINITNIIDNCLNIIENSITNLFNKDNIFESSLNYLQNYINNYVFDEFASDISLIQISEKVDDLITTTDFITNNNFLTQEIFTISFNDFTNTINNDINTNIGNLFINFTDNINNLENKIDVSLNIINNAIDDLKNHDIIVDSSINNLQIDISNLITTDLNTETSIVNLQSDINSLTISGDYIFNNFVTKSEFTISFEEIKNNATIFNNIFNIIRNINYVKLNNILIINSYTETLINDFSLNITMQRENTSILTKLNLAYLVSCIPDCMLQIKIYYKFNNNHNLISTNILGTENTSFLYNNLYTTDITNLTNEASDLYNFYITTKIYSIGDNIDNEILNNNENVPRILNNGNNIFIIEEV